jgi:large subunit ribosomal protein L24
MAKIKKGDTVKIMSGKDKGKSGRVLKVFPKDNKVIVEGLNLLYKHARPKKEGEKGQRVQVSAPLYISKVMFVCPKCSKAIRIAYKVLADGRKTRWCRKCKEIF